MGISKNACDVSHRRFLFLLEIAIGGFLIYIKSKFFQVRILVIYVGRGEDGMGKYKIGDLVYAKLGAFPVVGTIINVNAKLEKYLVRFSIAQQDWYHESDLTPYDCKA